MPDVCALCGRDPTVERKRLELAARLEAEIRPLINTRTINDGYDCCGCSTYREILDHAIRIVKGET